MISLKQVKRIAEQKLRNASYLFDLPQLEKAIKQLREAIQFTKTAVDAKEDDVVFAKASPISIILFPEFKFLSPLEQVSTLIHETIHIYLDIKHAHDDLFLTLYRNVIKANYKHVLVGRNHYFTVGGFRYTSKLTDLPPPFTIVCPVCKTPKTIYEGDMLECPDCGYEFS